MVAQPDAVSDLVLGQHEAAQDHLNLRHPAQYSYSAVTVRYSHNSRAQYRSLLHDVLAGAFFSKGTARIPENIPGARANRARRERIYLG
eukprot:6862408-Pyramimonas_sp.AAC.1